MAFKILDEQPDKLPESKLGYLGRSGARGVARGIESVLGLPGDIASGIRGLSKAAGIANVTGETYGVKPSAENDRLPIPTSEDIKKHGTQRLTGEYLNPRTSGEESFDEIVGDAAAIFSPVKGKIPFAKSIVKALGKSAIGNAAKWGAEKVTGSPLVGAAAKIGSMALASSLGGRNALKTLEKQSYDKAFGSINDKTKFNFRPEKVKFDKIKKMIQKGDKPNKQFLLDRVNAFENILGKGSSKASIEEAIELKRGWNEYLLDPFLSSKSKKALKGLVGTVNEGINRFGSKNKAFGEPFKIADELHGALQSSNFVQKFLSKSPLVQDTIKNPVVKHLLFGGAVTGAQALGFPKIAAGAGAIYGASELAKQAQLLIKSPTARKYYKEIIQDSLKNDTRALAKNLKGLEKEADKFIKKNPEKPGRFKILD